MNHQLIELLHSLDRKEMTRLCAFAYSPYHHKHEETRQLIAYLEKCYPDFPVDKLARQQIWRSLFPKTDFDGKKLALLFTYAWRVAEQFLIHEAVRAKPDHSLTLLEEFRKRKRWTAYERQLRRVQKIQDATPFRDVDYYRQRLDLAEEGNLYFVTQEKRQTDKSLEEKEEALDHYYILEKLRDAVELQVRRQIMHSEFSTRLLEGVLDELRQNSSAYADAPVIQVYFALYQMMDEPSLDSYQSALARFQANDGRFQQTEISSIYNYLQNFCIAQINRNQRVFLRQLFELYQEQLERQLLHEDGYLIEWHYKNIVTTAIRLDELDWGNAFIEQQRSALHPNAADNAYRFNKAAYCHAAGDYGKVLELLTQVDYVDLRYNLGAKALLLRTYYELDEYNALDALVESFRQYLQRNRLMAGSRRSGYYHLFRLTRRVAALRHQRVYVDKAKARATARKIREDMEHTEAIFNRAWLEGKLEDLEGHEKQ